MIQAFERNVVSASRRPPTSVSRRVYHGGPFIVLFLSSLLAGCGDGSTVHVRRWADGTPKEVVRVRPNGQGGWINDGKFTLYYPDGTRQEEGYYRLGNLHGALTHWHENGRKKGESHWENGRLIGKWKMWDKNGKPIQENPE